MWGGKRLAMAALAVVTLSAASAQITIIPQEKINQVANPTTAHSELMLFDSEGIIEVGTISEDLAEWKGSIGWQNLAPKAVAITRIQSSCGCLKASFDKRPTASGKRGTIEVRFVPKGRIGSVEQRLFVYTTLSEKHPTAIVRLKGKVTPSADQSGNYAHSCGELLLMQRQVTFEGESKQTERIAVMNGGSSPLTVTHDKRLTHPALKAYTEPATLAPHEQGDLVVEYDPTKKSKHLPLLYLHGLNIAPRERQISVVVKVTEKE